MSKQNEFELHHGNLISKLKLDKGTYYLKHREN